MGRNACRHNNRPLAPRLVVNAAKSFRPLPMVEGDFLSLLVPSDCESNEDAEKLIADFLNSLSSLADGSSAR